MPIFQPIFTAGNYYHIFNRGVAKQDIFKDERDYRRFLYTIAFYLEKKPEKKFSMTNPIDFKKSLTVELKRPLTEIAAYCLMPNHFHFLLKQLLPNGISTLLRRALNSYTHYFNTKYNRVGTIFQGTFRAKEVETDVHLLHLSRYIHLNPYTARLTNESRRYQWSSYQSFLNNKISHFVNPQFIIDLAGSIKGYQEFVEDYGDYARMLSDIKDVLIDPED